MLLVFPPTKTCTPTMPFGTKKAKGTVTVYVVLSGKPSNTVPFVVK